MRSGKCWRGAGSVPPVAEKLGIVGALWLWSPGALGVLGLKVLGKAVDWWVVLSPAPSFSIPRLQRKWQSCSR